MWRFLLCSLTIYSTLGWSSIWSYHTQHTQTFSSVLDRSRPFSTVLVQCILEIYQLDSLVQRLHLPSLSDSGWNWWAVWMRRLLAPSQSSAKSSIEKLKNAQWSCIYIVTCLVYVEFWTLEFECRMQRIHIIIYISIYFDKSVITPRLCREASIV